jgi:four helix bundle protein
MENFGYRRLVVYQHARVYAKTVYSLLKKFPIEERFALCDQLRRSVISIPSNIAEAVGRVSQKEQLHFIEFAFGSLNESMSQLELAHDFGYISTEDLAQAEERVIALSKLLSGLRKSILKDLQLH